MNMTKTLTGLLAAAAIIAIVGSANAGVITLVDESTWDAQDIFATSDAYFVFGPHPVSVGGPVGGSDPAAPAPLIRANSRITLVNPLALATGGYTSFDLDYAIYFRETAQDGFQVQYSALGDFTDTVVLKQYPTIAANSGGAVPTSPVEEDRWYVAESITVDSSVSGGFTDTAKIRFQGAGGANSNWAYIDSVRVTVVPEPASVAALSGLGGLCLLSRRRRG